MTATRSALDLDAIVLDRGGHESIDDGACLLELAEVPAS